MGVMLVQSPERVDATRKPAVVRCDDGKFLAPGFTACDEISAAIEFVDQYAARACLQRYCPEPDRWQPMDK